MPASRKKPKRSARHGKGGSRRWSAKVKTVSTFPPPGLFKKSASTIATALASRKVSPKGPSSGMRMLTFYINRAGHNLSASRRAELNKAKSILSQRIHSRKKASGHRPAA